MNSTPKRLLPFFSVFVTGALAGASLVYLGSEWFATANRNFDQPSEALSILEEEVMMLTYRTTTLTLTAQRSKPADRFAVQVTFNDGRAPQQCMATPDLAGQLASFSTISVERWIQAGQIKTEFPIQLGTLEIKDRMLAEALPPITFHTNANRTTIAATFDRNDAQISTRHSAFATLEAGCNELAQKMPGDN